MYYAPLEERGMAVYSVSASSGDSSSSLLHQDVYRAAISRETENLVKLVFNFVFLAINFGFPAFDTEWIRIFLSFYLCSVERGRRIN